MNLEEVTNVNRAIGVSIAMEKTENTIIIFSYLRRGKKVPKQNSFTGECFHIVQGTEDHFGKFFQYMEKDGMVHDSFYVNLIIKICKDGT